MVLSIQNIKISGQISALVLGAIVFDASAANPSQSLKITYAQLTSEVSLVQPNGSSILLSLDGSIGGVPLAGLALNMDSKGVLTVQAKGSTVVLGVSSGDASKLDGASLATGNQTPGFASIRLISPGQWQEISGAAPQANVGSQCAGTQDLMSFVDEKTDGYEIDLASGQGTIYFDFTSDKNAWQKSSDCVQK